MFWIKLFYIFEVLGIALCCIGEIAIIYTIYSMNDCIKPNGHDSIKDVNKNIKKKIEKSNKRYVYHDIKLTKKLYKRYNKNN